MANVNDVAAAIVEQCGQGITTMRLEKLAYYCQAWHLASTQHPLFSAEIQAFRDGPVVHELFAQHKGRRVVDQWNGNAAALSEAAGSTVRAVVAALADFEGDDLSALTHTEQPWLDARGGLAPEAQGNRAIEHASIQRFFGDKFRPGADLEFQVWTYAESQRALNDPAHLEWLDRVEALGQDDDLSAVGDFQPFEEFMQECRALA